MANSLASVVVTLTVLWIVLMTGLLCEWIYTIDMATWFLILASDTTIEDEGLEDTLNVMSSRFLMWFLIFEEHRWNEKWSGNKS